MVGEREDTTPEAALIGVVYVSTHTHTFPQARAQQDGFTWRGNISSVGIGGVGIRVMYNFIWLNIKANLGEKSKWCTGQVHFTLC